MKYFVIGDVHGEFEMLQKILEAWRPDQEQLVLLGDLEDRGPNAPAVFDLVRKLVTKQGAWCLKGNHEVMLLAFMEDPLKRWDHYSRNSGHTTINQLLGRPIETPIDPVKDRDALIAEHGTLFEFLRGLPLYIEQDKEIFVHAGLNLSLEDWHDTQESDFYWIREPFHQGKNGTGKTIFFGHTPLQNLNPQGQGKELWIQDHKIGLDGGAVFGGYLHGIRWYDGELVEQISVAHPSGTYVEE